MTSSRAPSISRLNYGLALLLCFWDKGFSVVLAVLEHLRPFWPWTQKYACLCLQGAGAKGVWPPPPALVCILLLKKNESQNCLLFIINLIITETLVMEKHKSIHSELSIRTHAYILSPQEIEGSQSCVARSVSKRKSMHGVITYEFSKPCVYHTLTVPVLWRLMGNIAWVQKLDQLGWHNKTPLRKKKRQNNNKKQKPRGQWDNSEGKSTCCQVWWTDFDGEPTQ